jgi:hypothetical protein
MRNNRLRYEVGIIIKKVRFDGMEKEMTIADWLMIGAVLLGPVIAVQLTRYLDRKKEIEERKLQLFKTLMATRSYNVSWDHVFALNRIDLEFHKDNRGEKAVIDAWKAYFDLLCDRGIPIDQWGTKRVELLVELLYQMAQVLKYDFDKTHIKNSSYAPQVHSRIDDEQSALRSSLIELLEGKRSVPITIISVPRIDQTARATAYHTEVR